MLRVPRVPDPGALDAPADDDAPTDDDAPADDDAAVLDGRFDAQADVPGAAVTDLLAEGAGAAGNSSKGSLLNVNRVSPSTVTSLTSCCWMASAAGDRHRFVGKPQGEKDTQPQETDESHDTATVSSRVVPSQVGSNTMRTFQHVPEGCLRQPRARGLQRMLTRRCHSACPAIRCWITHTTRWRDSGCRCIQCWSFLAA